MHSRQQEQHQGDTAGFLGHMRVHVSGFLPLWGRGSGLPVWGAEGSPPGWRLWAVSLHDNHRSMGTLCGRVCRPPERTVCEVDWSPDIHELQRGFEVKTKGA